MYKEQTQLPRPFHPPSFQIVTNPRLFSSLLLQYSAVHAHFLLIVFLFHVFIFWRNSKSRSFFFLLNIVYILYIYKLYIYIHIYMSGYLVLVYFFLWSPGILQERYFETNIFVPRLERCPLGLYVFFVLASSQTPSIQCVPLPHSGYNFFFFLAHWDLRAQRCS